MPHDVWASQNRNIKCVGSELALRDEKLEIPCSCFPHGRASMRATSDSMPLSACLAFCLFTLMAPDPVEFSPLSTPHCSQHTLLLSPTFLTSHLTSISLALEPSLEPGTQRRMAALAQLQTNGFYGCQNWSTDNNMVLDKKFKPSGIVLLFGTKWG